MEGVQLVAMHPYKVVLTALEAVPKTPALRDALMNLRPMHH
ncbi:MAG: hypothetical protein ABJF23_18265 [Bryobacteraceae bacterium]